MIDPINGKLVRASFLKLEAVVDLFRQLAEAFRGVEEKARLVAQPLMGKPKRNSWEIVSTLTSQTDPSDSTDQLAAFLHLQ